MIESQIRLLQEENEMLRQELRIAREAADITAQLVVHQFEETEKILHSFKITAAQRKAVLEAASEVSIVAVDLNGIIQLFNTGAARLLGYSETEIVGKQTPAVFHLESELESHCREASKEIDRSIQGIDLFFLYARQGRTEDREWTYVRKDGSRFPVSLSITPLYGADEAFAGFLCVAMDLTQRKRAEEEILNAAKLAEDASRTKSSFLARMSHELRTPLNAIIGYSEMLMENAEGRSDNEAVADLRKVLTASRHLLSLINDILDLSKIEAGKLELFLEPFDVSEVIHDVVSSVQPLVEKKSNVLKIETENDLGRMHADITRLRQVLFNMLSNACKFTEKGTITLGACREMVNGDEWLRLQISDTGLGMTPEQLLRLFQPFAQAESSTTKKYGGTGLGLVISRKLCQMMGGDITVTSEYGKGSTFTIRIPAEVVSERPAPALLEKAPASVLGEAEGAETVLVIDDDLLVHDLMRRTLTKEGFRVESALNGIEGVRRARELKPIAITLDVLMPGMDGWRVLKELKSDSDLVHIPVIMMTILEEQSIGYALGATDFLIKPVQRELLINTVRKYSSSVSLQRILVVDDDPMIREMMTRILSKEGWDMLEAENGRVALQIMSESLPGLILLDLMMPEMDGFEFLEEFRKVESYRSIPIVVITAKDLTEEDQLRLNGHVERVLAKGAYSSQELMVQIQTLMRSITRRRSGVHGCAPQAKEL